MGKGAKSLGDENGEGDNMAAWLTGINTIRIQPYRLPPLGPHDARVRMKAVGICGSDVHFFRRLELAGYVVKEPMVIGHECAGIIEDVGSEVKHLIPGDRVALEPGISCWRCEPCKQGLYNLCSEMKFFATPPVHGSLANQIVHPAYLCFKLPDNLTLEEGAMCEPLSVGVHACRRASVGPETNVLIMGAGPIGLVTVLCARAFGAPRIIIADVDEERLSMAKNVGSDECILVSKDSQIPGISPNLTVRRDSRNIPESDSQERGQTIDFSIRDIQDIDEEVTRIKNAMGRNINVTFDCAGFAKTMSTALKATSAGGRICLVGMGQNEMNLPLTQASAREVDIFGVFRYRNTWPLCLEFISSGKVDVKPLITHRFGFSEKEVEDAFETSAAGGNAIKVMFNL